MNNSYVTNKIWQYVFALQMVLVLMPAIIKANAMTPEIPEASDNEADFVLPNGASPYEVKRNWQSLHGAWGKRVMLDDSDAMDNNKMANMPKIPSYVLLINPFALTAADSNENMYDDNIYNKDKRGWKKMNVAWGKRRNIGNDYAPSSSGTGTWGKRQSDWFQLKGMWGKRSAQNQYYKLGEGFLGKQSASSYPDANSI